MTPEQVKAGLREQGITITQWASDNGYSRDLVYRVLNGFTKASYGKSHEVAVKLGLKRTRLCSMTTQNKHIAA